MTVISQINKAFLDKWKDFPGPNFLKFIFVVIGYGNRGFISSESINMIN
tara:strand:+ start:490 stop:636 length:147 start_codon:yes stop_codon:yes gene_type:complete